MNEAAALIQAETRAQSQWRRAQEQFQHRSRIGDGPYQNSDRSSARRFRKPKKSLGVATQDVGLLLGGQEVGGTNRIDRASRVRLTLEVRSEHDSLPESGLDEAAQMAIVRRARHEGLVMEAADVDVQARMGVQHGDHWLEQRPRGVHRVQPQLLVAHQKVFEEQRIAVRDAVVGGLHRRRTRLVRGVRRTEADVDPDWNVELFGDRTLRWNGADRFAGDNRSARAVLVAGWSLDRILGCATCAEDRDRRRIACHVVRRRRLARSKLGDDGNIIAALSVAGTLSRIDGSSGGQPTPILDLSPRRVAPRWPQILPGGKYVLYTAVPRLGVDQASIEIAALDGGAPRMLVPGGTYARYVAPGYLTFVNQGTLYAVRFSLRTRETRGSKTPILTDVAYSPTFGFAQITIAENGAAIYRRASSSEQSIVARIDSTGQRTPMLDAAGQWNWPVLSPDGQSLAVTAVESGASRLSVFTNLGEHAHLAGSSIGFEQPAWTRDGRHLVARGERGIVSLSPTGTSPRVLIESATPRVPWSFGPRDTFIAFTAFDPGTGSDLWTAPIEKAGDSLRAGSATPLVRTPSFELYPAVSPDGRWVAYGSSESGLPEVIVRSLTDSSQKTVIGPGTGGVPRWSRSGRRLFFMRADGRIMSVSNTVVGGKFVASTPRQWSPIRLANTNVLSPYDVGVDDGYIVALLPSPLPNAQAENHVTLIHGLPSELKRKVP